MKHNNEATEKHMDTEKTIKRAPEPKADVQDAALFMREMFGEGLAYSEADDMWLRWTGTHWQDTGRSKTALDEMAVKALRAAGVSISAANKVDSTIRLAKALMRREFVRRENLINFKNGTLEIVRVDRDGRGVWEIGTLREHDINDSLCYCLDYDYDPDGDYPTIRKYMDGSMPDPLSRECAMAHNGLALMHDTSMHYALAIQGVPRSGKSVWLQLSRLQGGAPLKDAASFAPSNLFDTDLEAKRARFMQRHVPICCIDELPAAALTGEENFKIMTSHGGVAMRGMMRDDEVDTTWAPKLSMTTNDIPKLKDPSGAMAARLVPILMPNHRPEGQRDLALVERMQAELGAFTAACLQVAVETKNRGYYNRSRSMMGALASWGLLGNPLRSFVNDYCELGSDSDPKYRVPINRLYQKYENRLHLAGQRPLQQDNMTAELIAMGIGVHKKKGRASYVEYGGKKEYNGWCMYGIALKEDLGLSVGAADEQEDEFAEDDYRPAVLTEDEVYQEVFGLVDAQNFDKARKLAEKLNDSASREYALEKVEEARRYAYPEQPKQLQMAA
jgi:phage/plasmid-associated DNA primase